MNGSRLHNAHLQAAVNMQMVVVLACKLIVQHVHVYALIMYYGLAVA